MGKDTDVSVVHIAISLHYALAVVMVLFPIIRHCRALSTSHHDVFTHFPVVVRTGDHTLIGESISIESIVFSVCPEVQF